MVGWYHLKTGQNGSDFKWHLKTGPFEDRTCLDDLNTGLVRYSDGYCIEMVDLCPIVKWSSKPFDFTI